MRGENKLPAGNILLRDVDGSDLTALFEHQFDPKATRMAGFPTKARGHEVSARVRGRRYGEESDELILESVAEGDAGKGAGT